jgi:AraC-like DNA-binding protein
MCDVGISAELYNPQVLYVFHSTEKGLSNSTYHSHDFIELLIIIKGQVEYQIEDKKQLIKPGNLLLLNPGVHHKKITDETSNFSLLHIGLTNFKMRGLKKDYIPTNNDSSFIVVEKNKKDFYKCCEEIINEQQKNMSGFDLILKALIMKLVILLIREIQYEENTKDNLKFSFESTEKTNIVYSIINYMNENYMDNISLDKIAKNMYLSSVYISKIFKEETGDSPINYLIKLRLARANNLLKENIPIQVVATNVGYKDAYYFSKLFKKYYGVPPSKIV